MREENILTAPQTEDTVTETDAHRDGECPEIAPREEDMPHISALQEENDTLRNENTSLKNQLICARLGVPEDISADIICMAQKDIAKGSDPAQAIKNACDRIKRYAGASVSTGVRSERSQVKDDPLRRAFGLK